MKNTTIYQIASVMLVTVSCASAANLITNGGFESFTGNDPDSWSNNNNVITTQVTGLSGTGSAVQLGITPTGSNQSAIIQNTSSGITATIFFEFDFRILTTGNVATDGDRTLNFTLRPTDGNTPFLTGRSLFDGTANDGRLQFFNGTDFISITGQTELFNQSDVYRIMLSGNISGSSRNYDVSIMNLTDNTSAGGQTGITSFQSTPGTIGQLRFERGRSNTDYIVDNVYLSNVAIPEPSTILLSAVGCMALLRRRR